MVGEEKKHITISVWRPTKEALDALKHPGQSYDGLIQELILKRKQEVEETRQRLQASTGS